MLVSNFLVNGFPLDVGNHLGDEEVVERIVGSLLDFLAAHDLVSDTAETLGDGVGTLSIVSLFFPVLEDLLESVGNLGDALGDDNGSVIHDLSQELEEHGEVFNKLLSVQSLQDDIEEVSNVDAVLGGLVHVPQHLVHGFTHDHTVVFLFLVSTHVSLSEESSLDDDLLGVFNKHFHLTHGSFDNLGIGTFHVLGLVLVESSETVVRESAQVKLLSSLRTTKSHLVPFGSRSSNGGNDIQHIVNVIVESRVSFFTTTHERSSELHTGSSNLLGF